MALDRSLKGEGHRAHRKHHTQMLRKMVMYEKGAQNPRKGALLLGTGDMFFHVVQSILGDSLLQDEILQLVSIAVVLDTSSNFAETIQEDFVIPTVVFIVPREHKRSQHEGRAHITLLGKNYVNHLEDLV